MSRTFLTEGARLRWTETAPADPTAPKVTEVFLAADISGVTVWNESNFQQEDSSTTDRKTWKDKGQSLAPTQVNYSGQGVHLRDRGLDDEFTVDDILSIVVPKSVGWLYKSVGLPTDTPIMSGQEWEVFRFRVDKILTPATDGYEEAHITYLPQGFYKRVILAAGSAPTATLVSPSTEDAGEEVEITGTNFYGVSSVKFGVAEAVFTVDSPTKITATVPAGSPGSAAIVVTAIGGVSSSLPFTRS